jgi:hypothetical protein
MEPAAAGAAAAALVFLSVVGFEGLRARGVGFQVVPRGYKRRAGRPRATRPAEPAPVQLSKPSDTPHVTRARGRYVPAGRVSTRGRVHQAVASWGARLRATSINGDGGRFGRPGARCLVFRHGRCGSRSRGWGRVARWLCGEGEAGGARSTWLTHPSSVEG